MEVKSALPPTSQLGPAACESDAKQLKFIEDITVNADGVQKKVLEEILTQNAETEYLKRFKLMGATDRETFKAKVPMISYEDIRPEIQRIANGDQSAILSSHPTSEFFTSSGTSAGESKLIPTNKADSDRRQIFGRLFMPVMNIYVPGLDKGKVLHFCFVKSETRTPGGHRAAQLSTSYYKSEQFQSRPYNPYMVLTSPNEAILCPDSFQSTYVQMLCGLYQREEVLRVGAVFASGLLRVIRFLQLHWEELAHDIATGTLNDIITDISVRGSVAAILRPNHELAEFIRTECCSGKWEGIVRRVWPNTKFLDVIVTGTMAQYIPTLEYYSGGLPMVSTAYLSSECFIGINLRPLCKPSNISYTIIPNMAYFEFLPHGSNTDKGSLVDLVDVEVGKEYELVATTLSGLYRYQVGDVLRATGFHNAAPQFEYVGRKNVLLSIDVDKTDEADLQRAVEHASGLLEDYHTSVVEYTSYTDTSTVPGHYVIYWELLAKDPSRWPGGDVLQRCCLAMEEKLSAVYRQNRVENASIGPLEIRVVRPGTFEGLMDYALSRGTSINQYKVPRCIRVRPLIELLDSKVVSAHFSPALPTWEPLRLASA